MGHLGSYADFTLPLPYWQFLLTVQQFIAYYVFYSLQYKYVLYYECMVKTFVESKLENPIIFIMASSSWLGTSSPSS